MKFVVYTAIFGNYDKLRELRFKKNKIEYICFTDNKKLKSRTWKVVYLPTGVDNSTIANRKIKLNVLDYLSEYDKSIYIDGNIQVLSNLRPLFDELGDFPMAAINHRQRSCIFKEAMECVKIGKANDEIIEQVNKYRAEGFPENYGMTENCILLRNHRHKDLKKILDLWWEQFDSGIKRDQISLPYITWKYNLPIKSIKFSPKVPNSFLRWWQHEHKYKGLKKIKYLIGKIISKEWRVKTKLCQN